MKIVSWNCNGKFREKFKQIASMNADIYVIQECENPKLVKNDSYLKWCKNYLWLGENKNKGLGIFSNKYKIDKQEWAETFGWPEYFNFKVTDKPKYFLPCKINNLTILGIWAHQNNSPTFGYIGQIWKYLQINKDKLKSLETLVLGDFNSNQIWDEIDTWWNHSDVIRELDEIGIVSIYHDFNKEKQGMESKPTLFFQRNKKKPYHIDYIFGSSNISKRVTKLDIGEFKDWIKFSDHMPVIVEF